MQKRLYTTIDQITLSIDSCNHADSFFKERIDSISYKVHEYEEFYYNCFFPSLRLLDESTTEYVVQEFGVDKADISYFMIGLAHAKRNKIQLNDKSLLLVRAIAL